ncbi:MAG TPA: sigma-70 family RNA polymerase sigma factor [Firmicutes bacterium]|nr:sigma-70 family RNA polymerase sigma factor [Bacillota bacterium]
MDIGGLVRKIQGGDSEAFARLYEETRRSVYYTAYSVCRDKYAAETIMQDAFVKFYENIGSVDAKHNPYAYLLTISRNLALNLVKREKSRVTVEPEKVDYVKNDSTLARDDGLTEFAARVLTEREFRVLMLCAVHKYKRHEVGKMLDMPTATVTWTYNKAISKLKKKLEEEQ